MNTTNPTFMLGCKMLHQHVRILLKYCSHFTFQTAVPVSMQLEIAPQHHLFMIGRSGANIKQIMQRTGASIHFPDPNTSTPQRKGTVIITGAIESVFLARQQVIVSKLINLPKWSTMIESNIAEVAPRIAPLEILKQPVLVYTLIVITIRLWMIKCRNNGTHLR